MAIKPILFNTPMVQAILDGRKTVTRRVANINTEIPCIGRDNHSFVWDNLVGAGEDEATGFICKHCGFGVSPPHSRYPCGTAAFRPRYVTGDILYVRETWCDPTPDQSGWPILYKASMPMHWNAEETEIGVEVTLKAEDYKWRPSIHMPKEAARIFLRVTDVRVERLQDIDGEQAYSEGATADVPGVLEQLETHGKPKFPKNFDKFSESQKEDWFRSQATATYIAQMELANRLILSFKEIWDSTIKKEDLPTYGWDANPWVWAYRFEQCGNPFAGTEAMP